MPRAGPRRLIVIALVVAVLTALLSLTPLLLSRICLNIGMLSFREALQAHSGASEGPLRYDLPVGDTRVAKAAAWLQRAVAYHHDVPARWAWGRVALAAGDPVEAAEALLPLQREAARNPLLYADGLRALSLAGRPAAVIAWYEAAPPPVPVQAVSDTVALAYLDMGKERGNLERGDLQKVLALRPGDLYANYTLWREARESGALQAATAYSETLAYFPLEAIHPADERLLEYAGEVIPALLEEGLWGREKALNVVSFLVWEHHGAAGVEHLLGRLVTQCPTEPDWPFYLAELYHRRGDLEQADAAYRQVLEVDPGYAQAYLRLGTVAEDRGGQGDNATGQEGEVEKARLDLEEAARWYARYYEMAPDDLLGLKKLAQACAALDGGGVEDESCRRAADQVMGGPEDTETSEQGEGKTPNSPADVLQEALAARTDDRRIVAEMLGVPVESVELGPNLVENGGFEEWIGNVPESWQFGAYLGQGRDKGLYVPGLDSLAGPGNTSRIEGLRSGSTDDGPSIYGEYLGRTFVLSSDNDYFISLWFRTQCPEGGVGLIFIGEYSRRGGLALTHTSLEDSSGRWRKVSILVEGPDQGVPVGPLIRNWTLGSIWFDDVQVRPVYRERQRQG